MKRIFFCTLLCLAFPSHAGQAEAESAVARIQFDADMENASFKVRGNGFIDIRFGAAVNDADYSRILEQLRSHPDIRGVLPGRSGINY